MVDKGIIYLITVLFNNSFYKRAIQIQIRIEIEITNKTNEFQDCIATINTRAKKRVYSV